MPRIDKYLWAIRIFKTRSIAGEAIKGGKVKINQEPVKASRIVKIGDKITVQQGIIQKTIQVSGLLDKRLAAKDAVNYYIDLTPEEEYRKIELLKDQQFIQRDRGTGRPTKKDRRDIEELFDE